jgi:membrane protease YdiL (CAAX protease family)
VAPSVRNIIHRHRDLVLSSLLLVGFIVAVGLRVLIGGHDVAQSTTAGLIFAVCLVSLSMAVGVQLHWSWQIVGIGLLGGTMLCIPAALAHALAHRELAMSSGYISWAAVASIVAFSEELFLRGALFAVLTKWHGEVFAVTIGALAFACLHIPLYGWHVLPLDFGVGLFLGTLRLVSGSVVAPGIAHVVADLVGWWLR